MYNYIYTDVYISVYIYSEKQLTAMVPVKFAVHSPPVPPSSSQAQRRREPAAEDVLSYGCRRMSEAFTKYILVN